MQITIFTLVVAIIWVSIFIKIISLLRKEMAVLKCFSIYPLLMMLMLCMVRAVFPVELPFTYVIELAEVLPKIQGFLCNPITNIADIDISIYRILISVWILGAVIIMIRNLKRSICFWRSIQFFTVSQDIHLYDLLKRTNLWNSSKPISIIVDEHIKSPAITGFVHPVIFLPDISFNDDQLLGIFTHELAHYKLKHQFVKLAASIIQICFWWNPAFHTLSSEVTHALEMHSDKAVCSRLNHAQQREYLYGISKVLENKISQELTAPFCCSLIKDDNAEKLLQRFEMIKGNHYQSKKKLQFMAIPFIAAVFIFSYAFVVQPYSEPTPEDIGEVDALDADSYFFVETEKGYDLYDFSYNFVFHMEDYPDEYFREVKIYKNMEDVKK